MIYPRNSLSQPELASTIPDSQTRSPDAQKRTENTHGQAANGQWGKKMSQKSHTSDATEPLSQTTFDKQLAGNRGANGDGNTLQTGGEDHTGDVDLVSSLQLEGPLEEDEGLNDGIAGSSPQQTQIRPSQFPESQRFYPPSARGRKRDSRGNEIISPQLPRNPLAGQTNGATPATPAQPLGLSQIFQATQAATSPYVNAIPTELHSDRPSPYVNIQARPHTSGPGSSPLIGREGLHRSLYEPLANYTTLDESQAKKKSEEPQSEFEEYFVSEDDSDESPNHVRRRDFEGRRIEKRKRVFVATPYSSRNIKVSRLASSPPNRQRGASTPSSLKSKLEAPQDHTIELNSDDENEVEAHEKRSDDGGDAETERAGNEFASTQQPPQKALPKDDDKENVDVDAVQVPDTTKRPYNLTNGVLSDVSPSVIRAELHSDQVIPSSSLPNGVLTLANSQHINVVDSQRSPKVQEGSPKLNPPLSSLSAQNTTTVPQSQLPPSGTHVSASPTKLETVQINTVSASVEPDLRALDQQGVDTRDIGSSPMKERTNEVQDHNAGHREEDEHEANGSSQAVIPDASATKSNCSPQIGLNAPRQTLGSSLLPEHKHIDSIPDTSPPAQARSSRDSIVSATAALGIAGKSSSHASSNEKNFRQSEASIYETAKTHVAQATTKAPTLSLSRISSMCESPNGGKRKRMSAIAGQNSPEKHIDSNNGFSAQDFFHEDAELHEALGGSSPIQPGRNGNRRRLAKTSGAASGREHFRSSATITAHESEELRWESTTPGHVRSDPIFDVDATSPPVRQVQRSVKLDRSRSGSSNRCLSRPRKRLIERMIESRVLASADTVEGQDRSESHLEKSKPVDVCDFPLSLGLGQQINSEASEHNVVAPNHVFAQYERKYYPAKCLAMMTASSRYIIQWPGYEPDEVDIHGMRRLELRLGDHVKVDLDGIPKVTHVVRGFKCTIRKDSPQAERPMTDIFGNDMVVIAPKQSINLEQCRTVTISKVYLDSNMWKQMKDRNFEFKQSLAPLHNSTTPKERPSTPSTPLSRSRRTNSHLGASSFSNGTGLFAGMGFAVSYDDNSKKESAKNIISQQCGQVLESGFQGLFEIPASSPISPSGRAKPSSSTESKLVLRSSAKDLKFVALITDRHSRKAKYLQALALNFPCLSGKWLEECVKRGVLVDWSPYLLPAGDSKALDGATKSRILAPYDPSTSSISTILNGRTLLFGGDHVTFIKAKGRKDERKEEIHNDRMFLLKAMGASELSQVNDQALAKSSSTGMNSCDGRRWIVHDETRDKSSKPGASHLAKSHRDGRAEAAIVVFDFIVQSLIHGSLLDS